MIVISEPYLRFSRNLAEDRFSDVSARVLTDAEGLVFDIYQRDDLRVHVRIEQGSTRVWISVSAVAAALIWYGSIRQSIDYLIKDSRTLADLVTPRIQYEMNWPESALSYRQKRSGMPGSLKRLFQQVERHELSPDAATSRAVELLYSKEGPGFVDEVPNLAGQLSAELHETYGIRIKRRRQRSKAPKHLADPPLTPFLPSKRVGIIVTRDPQSGRVKESIY